MCIDNYFDSTCMIIKYKSYRKFNGQRERTQVDILYSIKSSNKVFKPGDKRYRGSIKEQIMQKNIHAS